MISYVIANIQGLQFKLFENKYVFVPHLPFDLGKKILLNKILFFYKKGIIHIGTPFLEKINVNIEVLQHIKGKKIIVFKKKRRKGYKVKNGFRPIFSKIKVISFSEKK
ncbi:50S ribosomal protein L21 [Blattabacterium cuenoti]|uniref:50S ribosomal protein L21 n=1 Tax=Blattabacterium cuenoti TaxID=1653831 RepID=UPI001EEB661B|nr:50S ribosomal protein L21 [Blattabacterium cuenoti]